jgi:hypothetical protein
MNARPLIKFAAFALGVAIAVSVSVSGVRSQESGVRKGSEMSAHVSRKLFEADVVPYNTMRYPTAGDWILGRGGVSHISVAKMGNRDYEFLVALHELVEAYLCVKHGVTQTQVDAWDMGPGKHLDEPGDDPGAPYHTEHMFASHIETLMAQKLGVNWADYEKAIEDLGK